MDPTLLWNLVFQYIVREDKTKDVFLLFTSLSRGHRLLAVPMAEPWNAFSSTQWMTFVLSRTRQIPRYRLDNFVIYASEYERCDMGLGERPEAEKSRRWEALVAAFPLITKLYPSYHVFQQK